MRAGTIGSLASAVQTVQYCLVEGWFADVHLEFKDGGGGSQAVKPKNWLMEAGPHLWFERACHTRCESEILSSLGLLQVKVQMNSESS